MNGILATLALGAAWLLVLQVGTATAQQPRDLQATPLNEPVNSAQSLEALFTPEDDAIGKIVAAIGHAKRDIRVQAYLFTSRKLANALVRAQRSGVEVAVIVDREQLEKGGVTMAAELAAGHVPVYVDGEHNSAHNKIILIDTASNTPVVITGSYNFTVAAQTKNAENLLILRGQQTLAAAYRENWDNHRKHSQRLQ